MHMVIPSLHVDDRKTQLLSQNHSSSYITLRTSVNDRI